MDKCKNCGDDLILEQWSSYGRLSNIAACHNCKSPPILGRSLSDAMDAAAEEYARNSDALLTGQSTRLQELEAENADLKLRIAKAEAELQTALKHLRGH